MKKIGLLINPVAGIGGKVGLKGSDGAQTQAKARALGARAESGEKAARALAVLAEGREEFCLLAPPGEMGMDVAAPYGFQVQPVGTITAGQTDAGDTLRLARQLADDGAELILFAGGDGTARNIMDALGEDLPVIGIPTGCKIYSAVYAINPEKAGHIALQWVRGRGRGTRLAEVLDIDEDMFRQNQVQAKLYGRLLVPNERTAMQNLKSGGGVSEEANVEMLTNYVSDTMQPDTLYIYGSGSTLDQIARRMGLDNTLLGVDLVYNRQLIAKDVAEQDILQALDRYPCARVLVTIIGGQGYLFGRGNQQLSAAVLARVGKENIQVVATRDKVMQLFDQKLYLDTGDPAVNQTLCGYYKVIVGYEDYIMKGCTC